MSKPKLPRIQLLLGQTTIVTAQGKSASGRDTMTDVIAWTSSNPHIVNLSTSYKLGRLPAGREATIFARAPGTTIISAHTEKMKTRFRVIVASWVA